MMNTTARLRCVDVPGVRGAVVRVLPDATEQVLLVCDRGSQERGLYPLLKSGQLGPPLELFEEVCESGWSKALRVHTHSAFLSGGVAFCPALCLVFFCEGHAVYSLTGDHVVRLVAGNCSEAGEQPGFGFGARFTSPSSISVIAPGKLCVADDNGLHQLIIPSMPNVLGPSSTLAQVSPILPPLGCEVDLTPAAGVGPLVAASRTALYKTSNPPPAPASPAQLSPCCSGLSLWVGAEEPPCARAISGMRSSARFLGLGTLSHVSSGSLALLAVDTLHDGTPAVRGITLNGSVTTLFIFPSSPDCAGSSGFPSLGDDTDMMDIDDGNDAQEGCDEYDPAKMYDTSDEDNDIFSRCNNAVEKAKGAADVAGMGAGAGAAAASGLRSLLVLQRDSTLLLCAPMVGQVLLLSLPELFAAGSASRPRAPPAETDLASGSLSPSPSGLEGTARRQLPPRRLSFSSTCTTSLYCSSVLSSPLPSGASFPSYGELQAEPDSTPASSSGAAPSSSAWSGADSGLQDSGASIAWQGQAGGEGVPACGMTCEVSSKLSGGAPLSSSFALSDRSDGSGGVWSPVC